MYGVGALGWPVPKLRIANLPWQSLSGEAGHSGGEYLCHGTRRVPAYSRSTDVGFLVIRNPRRVRTRAKREGLSFRL